MLVKRMHHLGCVHWIRCLGVSGCWRQDGHSLSFSAVGLLPGDSCVGAHSWISFCIWVLSGLGNHWMANLIIDH